MKIHRLIKFGAVFASAAAVLTLGGHGNTAHAQVIQLPAYRQFSYVGGASVPDAGTGYLGGISYSAHRSVTRGSPFMANRAFGIAGGASTMSISVDIIDLEALDQAILSGSVPLSTIQAASIPDRSVAADDAEKARKFISGYRSVASGSEMVDRRDFTRTLSTRSNEPALPESLAESNIRHYLRMGSEAEKAGRIQSSRVYYRMAVEAMTPELTERYVRILRDRQKAQQSLQSSSNAARKPF